MNSIRIQWNHLAYRDKFCCSDYLFDRVNDMAEFLEVIDKTKLAFFFWNMTLQALLLYHCGLHNSHNKGGPYYVESPKLGLLSKHVKCKGHSKSGGMALWLEVIQVPLHNSHEINLYHQDVIQIWTIHGGNMKGSKLVIKLHEGTCILLCVPFH